MPDPSLLKLATSEARAASTIQPPSSAQIERIVNFAALHGVHLQPTQVNTSPFTLTPRVPFIAGRGALAAINSYIDDPGIDPAGRITVEADWPGQNHVLLHLYGVINQRAVIDCQCLDSSITLYAQSLSQNAEWSVNLTYDANHVGSFLTPPFTTQNVDITIRWYDPHPAIGERPPGTWTLMSCTVTPISA